MSRRRRRILFTILLLVFAYIGAQLWDIHRVGHLSRDRNTDCIIVLGAAAWHDKPSPVLTERLNHAIKLYKKHGFVEVGIHKNFFNVNGNYYDEILMDLYI